MSYKCSVCSEPKSSIKAYIRHFRIHSNNSSFQCSVENCTHNFNRYTSFVSHLKRVHFNNHKAAPLAIINSDRIIKCSIKLCEKEEKSLKSLCKHYRDNHLSKNETVNCPFLNCKSKFKTKISFSVHLSRYHRNEENKVHLYSLPLTSTADSFLSDNSFEQVHENLESNDESSSDEEKWDNDNILNNLTLFYLKLQSKFLIPASTIQYIAEEFNNIHDINTDVIVCNLKKRLLSLNIDELTINEICKDILDNDPLKTIHKKGKLQSSFKRQKMYKKIYNFVPPVEIKLGFNTNKQHTFFYVPILETIESMLKDDSVLQFYKKPRQTEDKIYSDYTDGKVFNDNKVFENLDLIHVILYQDAFEIANPIGSAKGKYKIVAFYLVLGNIPKYCRLKIEPMKLVLLCLESDFHSFGINVICARLIKDLQSLEKGVTMNDITVKGVLLFILGDNLGSHTLGGFTENFSTSEYFCRYCLLSRKEWYESLNKKAAIRTIASYEKDLSYIIQNNLPQWHGIKKNSPFNKLTHFHVSRPGLTPCIGHDIFEGVVQYDVAIFLDYIINKEKWFSLDVLNRRINSFNYVGNDLLDKPPKVCLKKGRLQGNAIQNWCLLRNLPIIMADFIQPSNPAWFLFLLLQEIVEFICSPKILDRQLNYLEDIIDEYLKLRKKLFPSIKLRPKHHYLTHYVWLTYQFGPLINVWTLRCESKHKYFKRCIRFSSNFKNVLFSLSEKHQLFQAYLASGTLYGELIEVKECCVFHIDLYAKNIQQAILTSSIGVQGEIQQSFKVTVKGTAYKKGNIVVVKNSELPLNYIFGEILLCLIKGSQVFVVVNLHNSFFDNTLRIYQLQDSNNSVLCVAVDNLLDYLPLAISTVTGKKCVKLKHSICSSLP